VPVATTRAALREAFARWGLPATLRLDNGYPWGHANGLPTALALWLAGLGLGLVFNPPRRPRDNGVVERSHGVTTAWAEPWTCPDGDALQARVDDLDHIQREEYALQGGRSRRALFPALWQPQRPYCPEGEAALWREEWARAYLAGRVARRRVDSQGKVTVYARAYHVGVAQRGQEALVQYDAQAGAWLFSDKRGVQWCRLPAEQITAQRILALDISTRPSKNGGKTSCPN
jgi:hypothetical protein